VPDRYRVVDGKIRNSNCEINVAEHCNLSCKGCTHLSPVLPKHFVSPAEVLTDLSILARYYRVDVVRLLGGEPLLHPDLPGIAAAVRASGVTERICVVTNGLLLARMDESFWRAVDEVEVSLYPGRSPTTEQQSSFEGMARAHQVELTMSRVHHFRQSYTEIANTDRALTERVFRSCKVVHGWRSHTVAHGMLFRCPQSCFLPRVLGEHFDDPEVDALRIEDSDDFGKRLFDFLTSDDPLASCSQCLGSSGHLVSHVQVRRGEFRAAQKIPAQEMISHRQGYRLLRASGRRPLRSTYGRVRRAVTRGARSIER
jgi:organic radical activating enzyme